MLHAGMEQPALGRGAGETGDEPEWATHAMDNDTLMRRAAATAAAAPAAPDQAAALDAQYLD